MPENVDIQRFSLSRWFYNYGTGERVLHFPVPFCRLSCECFSQVDEILPLGGRTGGRNFERVLVIFRPLDELFGRNFRPPEIPFFVHRTKLDENRTKMDEIWTKSDEIGRKMDETGRKVVDFFVHLRPPAVLSLKQSIKNLPRKFLC